MTMKNVFYAQSGGPTAVINTTACGVIQEAAKHSDQIGKVLVGRNGILGALNEKLIDTSLESPQQIAALYHTPGAAFGSCRYRLKSIDEDPSEYQRLIEVFAAHDIGYFFYNGGGDSQDTTYKVSQISEKMGYPLTCIGVPKTIDNDLAHTDNCPGFGSVAKYIATSTYEAALDVSGMAATSTKVFIFEVMGRHAGWIAASSALAKRPGLTAPQIILLPEVPLNADAFLNKVKQSVETDGYCVIVASEGVKDASTGKYLVDSGTTDAFGHQQLGGLAPRIAKMIKDRWGYKYHWGVADYLQRAARHLASKTDVDQAYAIGCAAVKHALAGDNNIMLTIDRNIHSDLEYSWKIGTIDLHKVANAEKKLPPEFIDAEGFGVTQACRDYLQPLIQGESYPPYEDGIPQYANLKCALAEKKLNDDFVTS